MRSSCIKDPGDVILYRWGEDRRLIMTKDRILIIRKYREEDDFWYNEQILDEWKISFRDLILELLSNDSKKNT